MRRALVLPVVLVIITFMALLSVSFAFQINAYRAGVTVVRDQIQLREAAESGLHHALFLLREQRHDPAVWYNNEALFHNRVVWSELGDWAELDIPESLEPEVITYRYSLVADDPADDLINVRYGITDESSKLNINTATPAQLRRLFTQVMPPELEIGPLIDALLDWRDGDNDVRAEGAEQEHYALLDPPYAIKNGPLETVEELLLVKGFDAAILYGEDADRNGLLRLNEDDGERSFPPDNEDGLLARGLYPYITVYSRDVNRSNENINRLNINGDIGALREELEELVSEETLAYIASARSDGVVFTSPIELLGHSYTPGQNGNNSGGRGGGKSPGRKAPDDGSDEPVDDPAPPGDRAGGAGGGKGRQSNQNRPQTPDTEAAEDDNTTAGDTPPDGGGKPTQDGDGAAPGDPPEDNTTPPANAIQSPVPAEDLTALCDLTTAINQPMVTGQININTAPRAVLNCLVDGPFTAEHVDAILQARDQVPTERRGTPAWLLTEEVVPREVAIAIYPLITARGQQFSIEAIGHADHTGQMVRVQTVVDMLRGHVPQVLYYRDITGLGVHYPIRGVREGDNVGVRRRQATG